MSGVDLAAVKEIPGHKEIYMTMRYAHFASDHKQNAMKILGRVFSMDTYIDTRQIEAQKKLSQYHDNLLISLVPKGGFEPPPPLRGLDPESNF